MIRLLALDLDGTLLNSRGKLSERNRDALARARAQGVTIALVTGRRFRDARPIALDLGLDIPLISHNGALTKHVQTLETVSAQLLPLETAREVLRVGRSAGGDVLISDDPDGAGILVYDHISGDNRAVAEYIRWAHHIHDSDSSDAVRQVESLEDYMNHDPIHVAFSGRCEPMRELAEVIRTEMGTSVRVFPTIVTRRDFALLDVVDARVSKAIGVAAAATELGLTSEEVMAVGDNLNDIDMLSWAGTGVAMANSEPELHSLPGINLTASNDEDGVALAIERFVLES